MKVETAQVESILRQAVPDICPAAQFVVRWRNRTVLDHAFGWLDPDERRCPTTTETRFDLASVTKLFTVTAFMRLVESGKVGVDQPVGSVLPAFNDVRPVRPYEDPQTWGEFVSVNGPADDVDAGAITFRQLLTHSSGLPAWRPLFRQSDADAARSMALNTFFSYQPGSYVIYSDIGLILLGLAVEMLTGQRLDRALHELVIAPLGLAHTGYLPVSDAIPAIAVAPTEHCVWRQRRIAGQVHDENAYQLDGVAGHAGLFSTANDVARLGQIYLDRGAPLLSPETVAEMTRLQAQEGAMRRGLGFVLWTPDPATSSLSFSAGAFGHTGFTGTSLWIDPARDLVVALLSNEVYHGRIDRRIAQLRLDVYAALLAAIDGAETSP